MRIAIVGAGGLGGLYGGLLGRGGLDVTFIARGRSLAALREHGLSVKLFSGEEFRISAHATDDPREVGPVDLIWFCVKTYDLEAAARQALPMVGRQTMALPIQNGVDAPDRLAMVLGREHVLGGVGRAGATLVAPGRVEQKSAVTAVAFGELNGGSSARTSELLDTLKGTGLDSIVSADIQVDLWDKFVQVSAGFGVDCLVRTPESTYLGYPETAELFRGLLQEVFDVGRAHGVNLPEGTVESVYSRVLELFRRNPTFHGSMYYDMLAGRPLELDAVSGTVVRLGRAYGVATPLTFAVYAALKPFAAGLTRA
jgi:2-dehydropantoate 2-reductase